MIVYVDIISGKDICSDSYPTTKLIGGVVISLESKKIVIGDEEINTGQNASKEEEEEKLETNKQAILNIVHAHDLQKIDVTKKDFKVFQKQYWQKLKQGIDKMRYIALGFDEEYKAPADKTEAKNAEKEAIAKLDKAGKAALGEADTRLQNYKKNFEALQNFVKDEIEKEFRRI